MSINFGGPGRSGVQHQWANKTTQCRHGLTIAKDKTVRRSREISLMKVTKAEKPERLQ